MQQTILKSFHFITSTLKNQKLKPLKNIDLLSELSSDEDLNVIKTNNLFRGYAMSYKVEIIEKKDPIKQLEASKSSIKDLFNDLLNETKGFKDQIALKVMLNAKWRNLVQTNLFEFDNKNSDKS